MNPRQIPTTQQPNVAFAAPDRESVAVFHEAALRGGGRDNGAPGLRPVYHADYYGAFVLDPDGNNVEAVCHAHCWPLVGERRFSAPERGGEAPASLGGRDLEWRFAETDDLARLAGWNRELQQDEGAPPMAIADVEARLRRWLGAGYEAVVFEQEGPAGYALYRPTDPDLMEAGGIYLHQFFIVRDRRRSGLGTAAFRILAEQVVQNRRLVLEVLASNREGRAFWRSLGLEEYCTTYHLPWSSHAPSE